MMTPLAVSALLSGGYLVEQNACATRDLTISAADYRASAIDDFRHWPDTGLPVPRGGFRRPLSDAARAARKAKRKQVNLSRRRNRVASSK